MITFRQYLSEETKVKMSWAELDKISSHGDYAGEYRTAILKKLINKKTSDGNKLTLDTGEEIDLDFDNPKLHHLSSLISDDMTTSEKTELKNYLKDEAPFVTTDGKAYKLSDLKKSKVFGGDTKGSGGGAEETSRNECYQCVVGALAANQNKELEPDDITEDAIKDVKDKFDIDISETPEEIMKKIKATKSWLDTYIETANLIQDHFDFDHTYEFHRQSSWVKELYDLAKKLFKDPTIDIPFENTNKWNPADIWIVKRDTKIPKDIISLLELNEWLKNQFLDNTVVGVSLKKTGSKAKLDIKNAKEHVDDLFTINGVELLINKGKASPFSSKFSYIMFEKLDNEISLGTNQTKPFPIKAEIIGKHARHGSVGFKVLQKTLGSLGLEKLETREELEKMIDIDKKDKKERYAEIFDRVKKYAQALDNFSDSELEHQFFSNPKLTPGYIISKCQAMQLLYILKSASEKTQKRFVIALNAILSSEHEYSSAFAKVH